MHTVSQDTTATDVLEPVADSAPPPTTKHRDRRTAIIVVLLLLGVYWTTMGGHTVSVDGEMYLAGTRSLVHHTTVINRPADIDGVVLAVVPNTDGDPTTIASIGTLVLLVPGYVAGKVVSFGFPEAFREEALRLIFLSANPLMTAITGGLLFILCLRLGARRRHAFMLAMIFGLATWAWAHGASDFSEPGTAMVLTGAMVALTRWWRLPTERNAALVGLLAGCVGLTRTTTFSFIPVFLIAGVLSLPRHLRVRHAIAFGVGVAVPVVAFCANAWLRFGGPFKLGYKGVKFTTPFYEGLFGLFLSSGKGLIFYAPILLVVMFGARTAYLTNRRLVLVVGAIVALHLYIFSRFEVWSGEVAYGPRYMIPLLPIMIAVLAPIISREQKWVRGAMIAGAVGFLGPGLLGATIDFQAAYWYNIGNVVANIGDQSPDYHQINTAWNFQPRSSPLMQELRSVPELIDNTRDRLTGGRRVLESVPTNYEDRIYWYARTVQLDTWWSWWPLIGGPRRVFLLAVLPLTFLVLGLRMFIRDVRALRPAR